MKIKTITSLRIETGPRTTWFLGFSRPFVVLIYRLPELATVCFHIWRWPEYRFTSFARRFGFVSYPVGFMSLHRMLSARASGFEKKKRLATKTVYKNKHSALSTHATDSKKTLGYQSFKNAGAVYESNVFFFREETTKTDTVLLKCE